MISLARTDGARKDLLELCTHNPGKGHGTIDLYTTFPWEALCAKVAKLKVSRPQLPRLSPCRWRSVPEAGPAPEAAPVPEAWG